MPLGVDIVEPPMLAALEAEGITVRDGQQVMLDAREVKSIDEIILLNTACAMVDGAYQLIAEQLKPGIRESELVANVTKFLFDLGSEHVDNINAVSGERCSPHPHVFSDRIIRPGDQAFFDIIHTFIGYKTCYYRTFVVGRANDAQRDAYKQAREWIDASIELMRPGVDDRPGRQASGRRPRSSGSTNEMECFGLQFGHSVGLFLHERPIISRLNSLEHPVELKEGMVIALETYCPAKDGVSAARIEEEVVVTADGPAGHHPLPVRRAVRRQRVLRTRPWRRRPTTARATSTATLGSGCTGRWSSAGCFEVARPGAVLRGAGPRDDPPRRRPGGGRGRRSPRRCATTTTRSAPTAATTTRSPGACRWRRSSPSCSAAGRACWAARAARCT